jgi:hypothetical protein
MFVFQGSFSHGDPLDIFQQFFDWFLEFAINCEHFVHVHVFFGRIKLNLSGGRLWSSCPLFETFPRVGFHQSLLSSLPLQLDIIWHFITKCYKALALLFLDTANQLYDLVQLTKVFLDSLHKLFKMRRLVFLFLQLLGDLPLLICHLHSILLESILHILDRSFYLIKLFVSLD